MPEPDEEVVEIVSDGERIDKVETPLGVRYSHRYKDGETWKPCFHCGDLAGIPPLSRGGGQSSVEAISKFCSHYGRY